MTGTEGMGRFYAAGVGGDKGVVALVTLLLPLLFSPWDYRREERKRDVVFWRERREREKRRKRFDDSGLNDCGRIRRYPKSFG